jgi:hypothetical protein
MIDKLIGNSKKAKSWTAFWMLALCLMAASLIWLAYTVSEKNKMISQQVQVIHSSQLNLELKSRIIDSLTANCNDAKAEIVKNCDSVITQTQQTITKIVSNDNQPNVPLQITVQQQAKLKEANNSIERIKANLYNVKAALLKQSTKLFVQYNNKENSNQINQLLDLLKSNSEYVVSPAEYVDQYFSPTIKFYNYTNEDEEKKLSNYISKLFNIPPAEINVTHEKNVNLKNVVEIWLGTSSPKQMLIKANTIQLQKKN